MPTSTTTGIVRTLSETSFISRLVIFLREVLRGAAHHQPGHEDRQDRQDEHAVEAGPDPAGSHLAEPHVEDQQAAADAAVGGVERVDRAGRGPGRGYREEGRCPLAEPGLLALHRRARGLERRAVRGATSSAVTATTSEPQMTPIAASIA